ncbi:SDR family oxidoreductase [Acuticoccus sp. 2012]|uniref:SDR family oxidoreductase n=1 Tax=Acuticoccus mangrovi TaxID=2796142 RepID=A0A934IKR0_9HYPH|nr:SDR family oxidoreductase [Acuticoccus mangrovi]
MAPQEFSGKIALVTGGATGIGRAASLALAARGATVTIAGRRTEAGKAVVEEIRALGGTAEFRRTDVTDLGALEALHRGIVADHGRLDIAFDNAGYQEPRAPLPQQSDAVFDRVFDTNLRAVFHCLRLQIPLMAAAGGGAIVVNASVSGLRNPNPGLSLYSASKAAVISLAKSAAMEAAETGVRINIVAPGRVATEMMLGSKIMDMEAVAAGLPIRRLGRPEEVAEAVAWLASDAASFVVGHVLCTDGGFMTL